jgi:RNA:NAD 2'-phosphotransferase (TPT1/KptA family)
MLGYDIHYDHKDNYKKPLVGWDAHNALITHTKIYSHILRKIVKKKGKDRYKTFGPPCRARQGCANNVNIWR